MEQQILDTAPDGAVEPEAGPDAQCRPGRKLDHTRDQEILEAALDVLAETGYERMTMDMVAARAKAGKATVYRRWASKADLVVEAVACMKRVDTVDVPDTGSVRGDLVALIKPQSVGDAQRKLQVMAGLMSVLTHDPQLAQAVNDAIVEPRAEVNRVVMQRGVDRGEIRADLDLETISHLSPSMAAYRTLVQRLPITRDYLLGLVDDVVLPALGLQAASVA